jgi:hypothetical protein
MGLRGLVSLLFGYFFVILSSSFEGNVIYANNIFSIISFSPQVKP